MVNEHEGAIPWRKSLRNDAINYRAGWWAVTIQVEKNKSIFGAVVGEKVVLNALGAAVVAIWRGLPSKYPELELFDFVVMPNHFHALFRIHAQPTNRERHLGFLIGRFKGATSYRYGELRRAGEVVDIGERLWQRDYWDDLVSSAAEFSAWQKYIQKNPANWSRDRYGACTAYSWGNIDLLNCKRVAFVASQGFFASDLRARKVWTRGAQGSTKVDPSDNKVAPSDNKVDPTDSKSVAAADKETSQIDKVLISTFTSAQEREALRRALLKKRPLIAVFPAGSQARKR